MMSFFWPQHPNATPGAMARAGRVAHWVGLVIAVLWVCGAASMAMEGNGFEGPLAFAAIGLACAQVGRGLRYIMSAE